MIIYPSKKKMIGQTLLCIAFISFGFWLLIHQNTAEYAFFEKFRINIVIGLLTIIIFGSFLTIWIFKILDRKPGVIIDENGIVDNSTSISLGQIPWSDIESVKPSSYFSNVITVILKNPTKYIDKQKNPIKRMLLGVNYRRNGSPVNIQTLTLQADNKTLIEAINKHLYEYNKKW